VDSPFYSIYSHGFVRTAVCIPYLRVADTEYNVERTIILARQASNLHAAVVLFPELGITGYSNEDLFHQDTLLEAAKSALDRLIKESNALSPVLIVGAPIRFESRLFNCAVIIYRGQVLGITPKTYLPNYREYYEKRQFSAARDAISQEIPFLDKRVPFGNNLIFDAVNVDGFKIYVELCEDLWAPIPPSIFGALAGATILANLSASNITVGKTDYRRLICASQSAKAIAAYLYSVAGPGESTTDLAWDGYALIYENNDRMAESDRFSDEEQVIVADIDLERLAQDRMRITSFNDSVGDWRERLQLFRYIPFQFKIPKGPIALNRKVERFPYVPSDPVVRDERCYEVYNIQVNGLMKRLKSTGIERVVIGVSGGLDSTQALIVSTKTMDRLKLPRKNILAYTMPGFATSNTTNLNAHELMQALGVTATELDIRPACIQMFRDIGHPYAVGKEIYDVTFENVQAGERTSHLFRLANFHNAIVVGTGDLSELALGWTTFGVGDHMSHYNVNGSVPKTLIQYLIRWVIKMQAFESDTLSILQSILDTEISPELIPDKDGKRDQPGQSTEAEIGPYELQDFNLYYTTRFGFRPSKIAFLCTHTWGDKTQGTWPELFPDSKRHEYDLATIKKWLEVFLYRFFKISQFKRSVLPNGPKVGSGGSLSPRGDWRAPSDSEATVWIHELHKNTPED
jgi:NAD+ synthase (glutamine-hydrolysing)